MLKIICLFRHDRKAGKMTLNRAVALRIANLLDSRGITQYRLEKKAGISHSTMNNIMAERITSPTLTTIFLLARGFGMTPSEFLDAEEFQNEMIELE